MIIVFGIKVDISNFTLQFPKEKLKKEQKAITKILKEKSVSFIDI